MQYPILQLPEWFRSLSKMTDIPLRFLKVYNFLIYEAFFPTFTLGIMNNLIWTMCLKEMEEQMGEDFKEKYPGLYDKIVPTYEPGCKRVLFTNDWINAMKEKNTHLITDRTKALTKDGLVTDKGTFKPDVIIYSTGFLANDFLAPLPGVIRGKGGVTLKDAWDGMPRAYKGMTVPQFPNFAMLYGPNTNLGHNSIVFMMECQVDYIIKMISFMSHEGKKSFDTNAEVYDQHNDLIQKQLKTMAWSGSCTSWYKKADGRNPNNCPYSCIGYWLRL